MIPDPRAARSLRFSPSEERTVDGYHPSMRSHCARPTGRYIYVSEAEASCPNFEPRAHARLTGLTCLGTSGFVAPIGGKRREEPRSPARFDKLDGYDIRSVYRSIEAISLLGEERKFRACSNQSPSRAPRGHHLASCFAAASAQRP